MTETFVPNDLVPEFAVSDWAVSRTFYVDVLGFRAVYDRPEDRFSYLALGRAQLMIDEIGTGRTFEDGHRPDTYPFGRGVNLQIRVASLDSVLTPLATTGRPLFVPPEDRWYRRGSEDVGQRQAVVADPDGYLLRFCTNLGIRPAS